jgi:uncharacterized membrane protein
VTVLLDVVGLCLIVLGAWLIVPWLGLIVAGCGLIAIAFALDRGKPPIRQGTDR